ncbi:MAG: DUF1934 domain-containing protein [Clostridiales bacterium]|nr:DUF1934 domain-containing protein [Clostridiales bacterium]
MSGKRVLLQITGVQDVQGESDQVELTTVGLLEEDGTHYYLRYEEAQEAPDETLHTTVKVSKDFSCAEMIRTGSSESCLTIQTGKRHICHYGTEYGDISMGILGDRLEGYLQDGEGEIQLRYTIDINGSVTSRNTVTITCKET